MVRIRVPVIVHNFLPVHHMCHRTLSSKSTVNISDKMMKTFIRDGQVGDSPYKIVFTRMANRGSDIPFYILCSRKYNPYSISNIDSDFSIVGHLILHHPGLLYTLVSQ